MLKHIHRYPFLRFVLPLIVGIVVGDFLFQINIRYLSEIFFVGMIGGLLFCILFYLFVKSYQMRWLFGLATYSFMFFLGGYLMNTRLEQSNYSYPNHNSTFQLIITERPEVKERSVLCQVHIVSQFDSAAHTLINQKALLYLQKDSQSRALNALDELLVNVKFAKPQSRNNPDEFDYARYLKRKGVDASAYADNMHWKKIGESSQLDLREKANRCRDKILAIYKSLGFEGESLAVLSALTVGEKEYLDNDIRESYSIAGASHILAVSGMHIGFICALLLFLFRWMPEKWRWGQLARTLLTIAALWSFAFLVGMTPSAVRSVCMFSFLLVGMLLFRKQESLNVYFATAFLMLLFNPAWLFEIGFQLSFMAVGSILLFKPLFNRLFAKTNRIRRFLAGLLYVSIAAQIGVAPLLILYFSRFSTHFLLTNLLIVPLVSLIIYLAVAMLLLWFIPAVQLFLASLLKTLLNCLNGTVYWVEKLPMSSIDGLWMHSMETFLLYIFILLFLFYCYRRRASQLIVSMICLLLFCLLRLSFIYTNRPETSIVFYNVRNLPIVHCISSDKQSWIISTDSLLTKEKLPNTLTPYWNRLRLESPNVVKTNINYPYLQVNNQLIQFHDKRICMINDNRWQSISSKNPLPVDYLYLCKGYNGNLEELLNLFTTKQVILDSSLSNYWQNVYESECKRLGKCYISLANKGSVTFLL